MSDSIFSYKSLSQAVAGSCGSVCAMVVVMPLDTARTRLVLDNSRVSEGTFKTVVKIVKDEGVFSLFRGCVSTLECVAISNFIYFYTFHGLKELFKSRGTNGAKTDLFFSTTAGIVNVITTNPIWVVNVRIKMQNKESGSPDSYQGLFDGVTRISREEGIAKLWNGAWSSLLLVSNPTIKFSVYEWLKRRLSGSNLSASKAFLLGAVSSSVATILTYPLQVLQAKSRYQKKVTSGKSQEGTIALTIYLYRNFGASIFFKGLDTKLWQTIISSGFMFLAYEKILKMTKRLMKVA